MTDLEKAAPATELREQSAERVEPVAVGRLMRGQAILQWNRAQAEPPIAVTKELWVAEQLEQFYTRPAERKLEDKPLAQAREPLTEEQRKHVVEMWKGGNWTAGDIIDAVEAAHGIKGKA